MKLKRVGTALPAAVAGYWQGFSIRSPAFLMPSNMQIKACIGALLAIGAVAPAHASCTPVQDTINALVSGETFISSFPDDGCVLGTATLAAGATLHMDWEFQVGDYDASGTLVPSELISYGSINVAGNVVTYGEVTIDGPDFPAMHMSTDSTWTTLAKMTNNSGIISYGAFQLGPDFHNNSAFYSYGSLENGWNDVLSNTGNLSVRGDFTIRGTFNNSGQLELDGHREYTFDGRNYDTNGIPGTVNLTSTSQLFIRDGTKVSVGTTWGTSLDGGSFENEGEIAIGQYGMVLGESLQNTATGIITNNGSLYATNLVNDSQIVNNGHMYATNLVNDSQIVNNGHMELGAQFTGSSINGTFTNAGALYISGGTIRGAGAFVQTGGSTSGGTFIDALEISLGTIDIQGGSFCVTGSVQASQGPVTFGPAATLCPGHSPGSLTIGSDLAFNGATLEIDIAGTAPGTYDVLNVTGDASFTGGIIKLVFLDGFLPQADDQWDLLNFAGSVTGLEQLSLEVAGLPEGYNFTLNSTGTGFGVSVASVPVPEPGSAVMMLFGVAFIAARRLRAARLAGC